MDLRRDADERGVKREREVHFREDIGLRVVV